MLLKEFGNQTTEEIHGYLFLKDLTNNISRVTTPFFDKKQKWDNPWDLYAMSNYSTITSLSESPIKEGLIYAGTDDGIIQDN